LSIAWHTPSFDHFDHHHFVFNHRGFLAPGFATVAGRYAYDEDYYQRVWTRWGWRLVDVCY
jgi:hypothetical protein